MTDEQLNDGSPSEERVASDPVAALLQKALATPPEPKIHFLPGVQERIRIRTRGRYFAARRARHRDPIILLLIAATLILLIGALVFVVLEPLVSPRPPTEVDHSTQPSP
jgi:hypothetical protein